MNTRSLLPAIKRLLPRTRKGVFSFLFLLVLVSVTVFQLEQQQKYRSSAKEKPKEESLLSITSPADGETLQNRTSGKLKTTKVIRAAALDSSGIMRVEFYVNKNQVCKVEKFSSDFEWPNDYKCVWAIPYTVNATYTIEAKGFNAEFEGEEVASSSIVVYTGTGGTAPVPSGSTPSTGDSTKPQIIAVSPVNGAVVTPGSTVSITANAYDDVGVTKVVFSLIEPASSILCTDTSAPYSCVWQVSTNFASSYLLEVKAYDAGGNTSSLTPRYVNIGGSAKTPPAVEDTTPPTVSITSPTGTDRLIHGSTVSIAATASDASGIDRVEFYVDKVLKCTDTTANYSCSWVVPSSFSNTIEAKAYDTFGNSKTYGVYVYTVATTPTPTPPAPAPDTTPPRVTSTNPVNGATVAQGDLLNITAEASDNVGVEKVIFTITDPVTLVLCIDTTAPYSCSWVVPSSQVSSFVVEARAYDATDNTYALSPRYVVMPK